MKALPPDDCLIYALRDPRTSEIRYVGKSFRGIARAQEHCPPPLSDLTYKAYWVRKLFSLGLAPEIVVLEKCVARADLSPREKFWIAIGRAALGSRFTNATGGGDGCHDPTPELRARMGASIRAVKNAPGAKERISAQTKEIAGRPDVKEKKSAGMRKWWDDPSWVANHNAAVKAALNRPDVVAKRSAAAKAAHARPDVKERHRAALLAAAQRPEVRAKRQAGRLRRRTVAALGQAELLFHVKDQTP